MDQDQKPIAQIIPAGAVKVAKGLQSYLSTNNLSAEITITANNSIIATISLRDIVRIAFAELGIELAFSGRDEHEKGVIIDIDEERVSELKLNRRSLGFGQPVVRANNSNVIILNIEIPHKVFNTAYDLEDNIATLLRKNILTLLPQF